MFWAGAVKAKQSWRQMLVCVAHMALFVFCDLVFTAGAYPTVPNLEVTPGSLCTTPSERRYPERIAYCERNVDKDLKREVMADYDQQFHYQTTVLPREDFKIDHHIPLCMGGSNRKDNLWPQHKTVYEKTDSAEAFLCEKLAKGRLEQREAVSVIRDLKQHPEKVAHYIRQEFDAATYIFSAL